MLWLKIVRSRVGQWSFISSFKNLVFLHEYRTFAKLYMPLIELMLMNQTSTKIMELYNSWIRTYTLNPHPWCWIFGSLKADIPCSKNHLTDPCYHSEDNSLVKCNLCFLFHAIKCNKLIFAKDAYPISSASGGWTNLQTEHYGFQWIKLPSKNKLRKWNVTKLITVYVKGE